MLVVVDRGDKKFHTDNFFVFMDQRDGTLKIQWKNGVTDLDEDVILGKVVICMMPGPSDGGSVSSGFLETDDLN